jgi:hemerythrin
MQELRYPDAKQHSRGHAATMIHLNLLIQQVLDDTFDQVKWRAFFSDLFIRHIADEDIKLERFLFDRMRAAERSVDSMERHCNRPSCKGELSQTPHMLGRPSTRMGLKH